ncbi:MAG: glycosyl hydrolase family 28-related protein [Bryobacteraceae bacterium]
MALVFLFAVSLLAQTAPAAFRVTSYGADLSGKADSRSAFQAAIDAARRAGGGRVEIAPGEYRLSGGLRIAEATDIELAGAGALLRLDRASASAEMPVIQVERSRSITLRGFTLDANAYEQRPKPGKAIQFRFSEDALVEDVVIRRPYVGLSFRQGCARVTARRVTVTDYQEDGFDAGGDADEVDGGSAHGISFLRCVARDAPRCPRDGNAFEIEDGAREVRIENALVESVAGNGIALRNHQSKQIVNRSAEVLVAGAKLTKIGGPYAIWGRSAPRALARVNSFHQMTIRDTEAEGVAAFWGPIRGLRIESSRLGALWVGFRDDSGEAREEDAVDAAALTSVRAGVMRLNVRHATIISPEQFQISPAQ